MAGQAGPVSMRHPRVQRQFEFGVSPFLSPLLGCPSTNSAANSRPHRYFHIPCCARLLRARKNSKNDFDNPHSVHSHFALRAVARRCFRRAAPRVIWRSNLMLDHTLVHSCFGFHSSFEFRISSFTQVHGSLPDPPGTHRDTFWTLKGHCFSPVASDLAACNHRASSSLCLKPSRPPTSRHFFPRTSRNLQRPRSSLRGFPPLPCDPGVDRGRFGGRFGGAFSQPVSSPAYS